MVAISGFKDGWNSPWLRGVACGVAFAGGVAGALSYFAVGSLGPETVLSSSEDEDLPEVQGNHCKVLRFDSDFRWLGIASEAYKAEGTAEFKGISRTELVGKNGESCGFHLRYFEVAPGGYSTMEKHKHEHVVLPIRGQGVCMMNGIDRTIQYGDVVYISPSAPHQILCPASSTEPLGFLCLVNADRDKPVPLKRLKDGTFEEILGAVSACEFKPKHLRKPGDVGYIPPK